MNLPTWDTYCDNTTAANVLVFNVTDGLRVWFSYKTPVAFKCHGRPICVRSNDWGPTTGKHLNAIDGGDKSSRVSGAYFESKLAEALAESCPV